MWSREVGQVDFPTLGDLIDAWIEHHCLIPDGFKRREPFRQYDWQFWCTANHFRVKADAVFDPDDPPLNRAFVYRRTDVIGPQKTGKGPWAAVLLAVMAVGPSEFAGWAEEGDVYRCSDNGCNCGWEFTYLPGEPKGMRHPSPLLQALATSQEQVRNIWRPLEAMIKFPNSRLQELLKPREEFIRIISENQDLEFDRIDAVTSSAKSRLGNPITGYVQDETGTHTKQNGMAETDITQRRSAAGMRGRGFTTTNCWDPSENSIAQRDFETDVPDVFTFYSPPPKNLDFYNDEERFLILKHNYEDSIHVDVESVDAECKDLIARGEGISAERFFGNRVVEAANAWIHQDLWEKAYGMA